MFSYHLRGVCQILTGLSILSNLIWFTISFQVARSEPVFLPNENIFNLYTLLYSFIAFAVGVAGLVGFSRNHYKAIYLFGNFLIFDTVIAATGRFILISMTSKWLEEALCKPSFSVAGSLAESSWLGDMMNGVPSNNPLLAAEESCGSLIFLGSAALVAGIVSTSIIQFYFVGMVLRYAASLSSTFWEVLEAAEKPTTTSTI